MNISNLQIEKSRITIFDKPIICRFCSRDVFIPREVYVNTRKAELVEQPSNVFFVTDVVICQHCGEVRHYTDPSDFDVESNTFIWAMKQYLCEGNE